VDALIIGGGIAGLTAALCLRHFGVTAEIAEQAAAFGEVGAGLQLGPNAVKVLAALGLEDALMAHAHIPDALALRSGYSKHVMLSLPLADEARARWGAPYVHIHRADLVSILAKAAEKNGIACRFNMALDHIVDDNNGATLFWKSGARERVPFVVGADGVRSLVRRALFDDREPEFTRQVAWRALVERAQLGRHAPSNAATVWTGRGRHAVTYWLRGGAQVNFVGVIEQTQPASASWSEQAPREEALRDFRDFDPAVLKILRKTPKLHRWGIYQHAPLKQWSKGHAALIGDACHAMPPFLAQGAAMAIEDAWAFAATFTRSTSGRKKGLQAYQRCREARAQKVAQESRGNGERFHMRSGAERMGAFGALKAVNAIGKKQLMQQLDWLYGYDVTGEIP
jgi:salicylate hydroxylase